MKKLTTKIVIGISVFVAILVVVSAAEWYEEIPQPILKKLIGGSIPQRENLTDNNSCLVIDRNSSVSGDFWLGLDNLGTPENDTFYVFVSNDVYNNTKIGDILTPEECEELWEYHNEVLVAKGVAC